MQFYFTKRIRNKYQPKQHMHNEKQGDNQNGSDKEQRNEVKKLHFFADRETFASDPRVTGK